MMPDRGWRRFRRFRAFHAWRWGAIFDASLHIRYADDFRSLLRLDVFKMATLLPHRDGAHHDGCFYLRAGPLQRAFYKIPLALI